MTKRKSVLAISGSTRLNSSNIQIIKAIALLGKNKFDIEIYQEISLLPHFNPDLDNDNPPEKVVELRNKISKADGIIICTPEYIFSLPGALKNAIEWMVSTTLFSNKPVALITASGLGFKAHESLLLIMKTIYARYSDHTQMHLKGARTIVDEDFKFKDTEINEKVLNLIERFSDMMNEKPLLSEHK